ncbi:MAG: tRNA epoxyqueuosine(34) reductase QueG [Deltaproteobacteria bacterium]|nr:tRNA epoxyqueuosine(34) reductase QueG [Deltaproteobacteria bacterium]
MDLIRKANDLGFIAVGFSRPGRPSFFDHLRVWISEGKHAGMAWIERHLNLRENPAMLLEGCRTVITLAYPYSSCKPYTPEGLCAARYSEPQKQDYHHRLRKRTKILAKALQEHFPGTRSRICVDSAPIMERSLAWQSGIGFIGKNTQLIIPGHGSYVFLAEILTTAVIHFPEPRPMENRCGSCTRCLDACPTGAIEGPFQLNAGKCLSYRTIEQKEAVDRKTGKKMGDCFFGCDVCQEVCPFNQKHETGEIILPSANDILNMDEKSFRETYGKSAFARAGLAKIQSNIQAMDNERQV